MKKIYFILLFCLPVSQAIAQWETRIGLNLLPMSIGSYEISSEFSHKARLSLTANAGYLHKTRYYGLIDYHVGDGVENRRTSGRFLKAGVRFYVLRPTSKPRKVNLFMGALVIGSYYFKTADTTDYRILPSGDFIYNRISRKGFSWGPALTIGLNFRFSSRISLDAGMQYSYLMKDKNVIGIKSRNYEPGFGPRTSIEVPYKLRRLKYFPTNDQAIITLKYKFKT